VSDLDDVLDAAEAAAVVGKLDVATEIVDRYRMGLLGSLWCDAEGIPQPWDALPDEAQETIIERIKRQESSSPGDLAVRAARLLRDLRRLDEAPSWLLKRFMDSVDDDRKIRVNDLQRLHVYDSIEFGGIFGEFSRVRLFSNANVGAVERTNLTVAGQLVWGDDIAFATHFYVTTLPAVQPLYGAVTLHLGGRTIATGLAHQLQLRPQPLDVFIPPRQNFDGQFDIGFTKRSKKEDPRPPDGTLLYVHIEGYRVVSLR